MRDVLCSRLEDSSMRINELYKIIEETLKNELALNGRGDWREDEYIALAKKYSNLNAYIKDDFRHLYDYYFIREGMYIHACHEHLHEYVDIIRYIHPYMIVAPYLAHILLTGASLEAVEELSENLLENGLEHRHEQGFAENHCHLSGARDSNGSLLEMLLNKSQLVNNKKDKEKAAEFEKDLLLYRWSFHTINNWLLKISFKNDKEIDKFCLKSVKSLKPLLNNNVQANYLNFTWNLDFAEIERQRNDDSILSRLIIRFVKQIKRGYYDSALLLYLTAVFLKAKDLKSSNTFIIERITIIISIFFIQLNIFRSEMVMGNGYGLKNFIKVFNNPKRYVCHDTQICIRPLFMSGVTHAELRRGDLPNKELLGETLSEIDHTLERRHNELYLLDNQSKIHPCQKALLFSWGYHFNKFNGKYDEQAEKIKDKIRSLKSFFKHESNNVALKDISSLRRKEQYPLPLALRKIHFDMRLALCTLDAAGDENLTPPEVYAPYVKEIREQFSILTSLHLHSPLNRAKGICFAFHAGEDFSHIVTGMRRIHETIEFFHYKRGDRLGHALAIGLNPLEWMQRKREILLSVEEYFDNCLWLYKLAVKLSQYETGLPCMTDFYRDKLERILREVNRNRQNSQNIIVSQSDTLNASFEEYQDAYNARAFIWDDNFRNLKEWKDLSKRVQVLSEEYRTRHEKTKKSPIDNNLLMGNHTSYKLGWDNMTVVKYTENQKEDNIHDAIFHYENVTDVELNFWEAVQDYLLELCAQKGIILEANPSSNIAISDIDAYQAHPIFRWRPVDEEQLRPHAVFNKWGIRQGNVSVCINSDDPGIFSTTLQNEFRLIKEAAMMHYSEDKVHYWLDDIRKNGIEVFNSNYIYPFN